MKEYIGYCSEFQVAEMFKRFYNSGDNILKADEFAKKVASYGRNVSPAQIQGFFMMYKTAGADEVIANAHDVWRDERPLIKVKTSWTWKHTLIEFIFIDNIVLHK